ncbi:MAG: serine/threonine-protein phosphatase, partial [Coriobacteriia bacterium]|nr:serine/threonine-protein phosphatase [Coriobacteriia bacterium]
MATAGNPSQTMPFAPVKPTSRDSVSASTRLSGAARSTGALAWGSRTDVGRVREHNEDSYLVNFPLFAVADGMGGHAAGEVASTIAVSSLAEAGLTKPDPDALGAAIEAANIAVLDGVDEGIGRPGMGTTCTAVVIDGTRMAVGHVGDSRAYLLHE